MDYYSKLLTLLPEEELENKIENKVEEFHGYLSREVALNLLAKEYNLYKYEVKYSKINEIKEKQRKIVLKAKVIGINPTIFYPSGKKSREIILKDESGIIPFTLWEEKLILLNKIRLNDEIELKNAYERYGKLNLMYGGQVNIINEKGFTSLNSLEENKTFNIRGIVSAVDNFSITDGKNEQKIIILQGKDRFSDMQKNDEIILENILFKNNTIQVSDKSRIFSRRPGDIIQGEVKELNLEDNKLRVKVNEKDLFYEGDELYALMGAKKSKNISVETLINLKREFYIGRRIFIKLKNNKINEVLFPEVS